MFSLLHPAMLGSLAAISMPLLIHLLTRRSRRRLPLPTVRFLQRSIASQSRLVRSRHLILLALLILALAALCSPDSTRTRRDRTSVEAPSPPIRRSSSPAATTARAPISASPPCAYVLPRRALAKR